MDPGRPMKETEKERPGSQEGNQEGSARAKRGESVTQGAIRVASD